MIFKIYYIASFLFWPIYKIVLCIRLKQGKEIANRVQEKRGIPTQQKPSGNLIWFHGASVGETAALLPLLKALKEENPDITLLLTSGTRTSAELLSKQEPFFIHQFLPLDHPIWCKRFLDYWRPDLVCMSESDFWPVMLSEVKKKDIPLLLVNGRMSPKSFKNWQKFSKTASQLFSLFDHLFVQNEQDVNFFTSLGAKNITQTGTIKYSAPPLPFNETELQKLKEQIGERPFWLFASSHAGEEEITLETHKNLKKEFPDLLTILVPRHPNRSEEIQTVIANKNLSFALLSKKEPISKETDIYLADAFGVLGLLYKLCSITSVGGSFVKLGCHNPIEPAQLGCAILFGPYIYNFSETCNDLINRNAGILCADQKILEKEIKTLIKSPEKIETLQKNAYDLSIEKANILPKVIDLLKPYIRKH